MAKPTTEVRRYVTVLQAREGYPADDRPFVDRDSAPAPPELVAVVKLDDFQDLEQQLAARDERVLDLEDQVRDRHGALHELQRALSGQYVGAQVVAALAVAGEILNGLDEDERRYRVVEKSFRGLVGVARAMLDETYPPDVFVGGGPDTDPGVAFVVKLREALALVEGGGEHGASGGGAS